MLLAVLTFSRNAMWLRDSANQILSYLPVLRPSLEPNSLAALFRGVINAHSRYIKFSPYCHAYQPLPESGIPLTTNGAFHQNKVNPPYDPKKTFDCKWELDSLASFLQLSSNYFNTTGDLGPFEKYKWVDTVEVILNAVDAMRVGTYSADGEDKTTPADGSGLTNSGHVNPIGYTMLGYTNRATETNSNDGYGNPVTGYTGMIRSTFRPSDGQSLFADSFPVSVLTVVQTQQYFNSSFLLI